MSTRPEVSQTIADRLNDLFRDSTFTSQRPHRSEESQGVGFMLGPDIARSRRSVSDAMTFTIRDQIPADASRVGGITIWQFRRKEEGGWQVLKLGETCQSGNLAFSPVAIRAEYCLSASVGYFGRHKLRIPGSGGQMKIVWDRSGECWSLDSVGHFCWQMTAHGLEFDLAPSPRGAGWCPHLLVVDDNSETRRMVTETLESAGATVRPSSCTKDAMQEFHRTQQSSHPFDAIVTDFRMKESSGVELASRIRTDYPKFPIVGLTNTDRNETWPEGRPEDFCSAILGKDETEAIIPELKAQLSA